MASVQIRTEAPEGSIASAYNQAEAIGPSGLVIIYYTISIIFKY